MLSVTNLQVNQVYDTCHGQRFRVTASHLSKAANFNLPHLHLAPLLGAIPFEFCQDFQQHQTRLPGLLCGIVWMILLLAVSVEHRFVTERQTHDYSIYCASMVSCGKNYNHNHTGSFTIILPLL